jgi:hypothetical protein
VSPTGSYSRRRWPGPWEGGESWAFGDEFLEQSAFNTRVLKAYFVCLGDLCSGKSDRLRSMSSCLCMCVHVCVQVYITRAAEPAQSPGQDGWARCRHGIGSMVSQHFRRQLSFSQQKCDFRTCNYFRVAKLKTDVKPGTTLATIPFFRI